MAAHEQIYQDQAEAYEFMIGRQPDLSDYIREIRPYRGLDVLDLGAGSGRFSAALAKEAGSLICTDASSAMLALLDAKLEQQGIERNWTTVAADHRQLPLAAGSIDLAVSGWSICYLANTDHADWENKLELVMSELVRVLRPKGTIVIFETMGTGTESPNPPEFLTPYYKALREKYGFEHRVIRTDYTFGSVEEATESTAFFFGEELAKKIAVNQWSIVPECAGIWWKNL